VSVRSGVSLAARLRRPKLDQAKRLKDFERENVRLKTAVSELTLDKRILRKPLRENTKPKRAWVNTCALETSERRACAVLGQPRSTQRRHLKQFRPSEK
jgi:hypothetical protein